ncbi:MAG: Solitary outer membrane autotransporter beta-barrel domain [Bdellovibrionales bacterium]|nr:Solitary outer membrane autotransporter beta-barrel domain [Bdellovibrionales bacterium]
MNLTLCVSPHRVLRPFCNPTRFFAAMVALMPLLLGRASAQTEQLFDQDARKSYQAATNALVSLASDDSFSGGIYKLKSDDAGSSDADIDLFKVIGEFPIGDSNLQFVPLLAITPSYLKLEQDSRESIPPANLELVSWGIGLGTGVQMKFFDNLLQLTPRFKAEYSELDYDFGVSGVDDALIDQIIPDVNTWSYIPSLEALVQPEVADDGGVLLVRSKLSYVYVNASTSNSNISSFSSDSWVARNQIAYEQPLSIFETKNNFIVRPGIGRVDLHGAARDGFEFNNFYEFSMDLLSREIASDYFQEIGLGATYVHEQEIQGWRFGVFGSLN